MRRPLVPLRIQIAVSQLIAGIFRIAFDIVVEGREDSMYASNPLCTLHNSVWLDKDWPFGQSDEDQQAFVYGVRRKEYPLRLLVLTYRRANSLLRLLNSLQNATYFGDSVALDIFIDRYLILHCFMFEAKSTDLHI